MINGSALIIFKEQIQNIIILPLNRSDLLNLRINDANIDEKRHRVTAYMLCQILNYKLLLDTYWHTSYMEVRRKNRIFAQKNQTIGNLPNKCRTRLQKNRLKIRNFLFVHFFYLSSFVVGYNVTEIST